MVTVVTITLKKQQHFAFVYTTWDDSKPICSPPPSLSQGMVVPWPHNPCTTSFISALGFWHLTMESTTPTILCVSCAVELIMCLVLLSVFPLFGVNVVSGYWCPGPLSLSFSKTLRTRKINASSWCLLRGLEHWLGIIKQAHPLQGRDMHYRAHSVPIIPIQKNICCTITHVLLRHFPEGFQGSKFKRAS